MLAQEIQEAKNLHGIVVRRICKLRAIMNDKDSHVQGVLSQPMLAVKSLSNGNTVTNATQA